MKTILILFVLFTTLVVATIAAQAQSTEFTYQGKLTDGGSPANGNYDLELKLYDSANGGSVLGTQQKPSVVVNNGVFTVQLDFGLSVFAGPPRFLEIGVRPAGTPDPFTLLTPRQPVSSTPYAVRSLNASVADTLSSACVGCVTSSQIGSVDGATITGSIPGASLPSDSASYVQNTVNQQASSNFNISGTGSANIFNATKQYNLLGVRVLSITGSGNLMVGVDAGTDNTGSANSFFGEEAGKHNTHGTLNSFFGSGAGIFSAEGNANSYFGNQAGAFAKGSHNSFFGANAGSASIETVSQGSENSFFGYGAGLNNLEDKNSFFGFNAGNQNENGFSNSFFGYKAGASNQGGSQNSYFGSNAGGGSTGNGFSNSFFGYTAGGNNEGSSNSFFGVAAGFDNTAGNENSYFGASAGHENTTGERNAFIGRRAGHANTSGSRNTFIGTHAGSTNTIGNNNTTLGYAAEVASGNLSFATAIGSGAVVDSSNTLVLGRTGDNVITPGNLFVKSIPGGGNTTLCRNSAGKISNCSSSLRYKTSVHTFIGGLSVVRRLRPITFNWKDGGMLDVGFGAEEVARVEPLLTTRNDEGQIEGVKYAQISTVLVNAVNEQQSQIESLLKQLKLQQQQNQSQQEQIEVLKSLVCLKHRKAEICK